MDTQNIINTVGLIVDVAGVIIIAVNKLPPDFEMLEFYTEVRVQEKYKELIRRRRIWSRLGFALVIIGFVFQILATTCF